MCACAHDLSLRLRDSSTCGAVPERSEGMSREDGEVRIARRWRRSETKPTPEAPEIYSVLRCPAVLFLTIWHYSAENAWIPIEAGGYIFINCLWIASVIESIAVNFDLLPASLFLFFYIRYCEFDCFIGTDCLAVAAAYTVHAVGIPPDGNV